ncbi:hypothetical protein Pelo_14418 [Pelomyxa schiedti]|nr:hypothetical protein Pelo_14418 [Pelomyxa schiedti]
MKQGARLRTANNSDNTAPQGKVAGEISRQMLVSRVVWDHIIEPALVRVPLLRGEPLELRDCVWALGVADALFPLVPRACRLVAGAWVRCSDMWHPDAGATPTSRYFVLKCAGAAGSGRCIFWVLRNKGTRNNRKECLAVLRGLCLGGHIEMAEQLVESGDTPWVGCSLLRWPVNESDLIDDIREMAHNETIGHSLLYDACRGGHLDVVKWVMSKFNGVGTEPWELPMPFRAAVKFAHLDVVKWLVNSTDVVNACEDQCIYTDDEYCDFDDFISSPSLEVVKLCTELFFGHKERISSSYGHSVLTHFADHCSEESSLVEGCNWIIYRFSVTTPPELCKLTNAMGFKWMILRFSLEPSQGDLRHACAAIADDELVKWLIMNFFDHVGAVEPTTFISACGNIKDTVSVPQCLLPNVTLPLSSDDLRECLLNALSCNNTAIADWLEMKFHVMSHVNAIPSVTDGTFRAIFYHYSVGLGGFQWFLDKCTISNITEGSVNGVVNDALAGAKITLAELLQNTFDVPDRFYFMSKPEQVAAVKHAVSGGDLARAKEIVSRNISLDAVIECLSTSYDVQSGKVTRNDNNLLRRLIESNKKGCAEWLIHKFHVTLTEVLPILEDSSLQQVGTWKMLLRVFPEITGSLALTSGNLRSFVVASHLHINVSKKILGLTDTDIDPETLTAALWLHVWIMV